MVGFPGDIPEIPRGLFLWRRVGPGAGWWVTEWEQEQEQGGKIRHLIDLWVERKGELH